MPLSTWNYAAPFFCLMSNVENGAFEKRFGEKFQAVCFPFGGEIEFRPPGERNEVIPVHKFSGNNVPGIFLGYRLQPGMAWSGDYTVVSRDDLLAYVSGQTADFRVHHVPEVRFPDGVKFPMYDALLDMTTQKAIEALKVSRLQFVEFDPDSEQIADLPEASEASGSAHAPDSQLPLPPVPSPAPTPQVAELRTGGGFRVDGRRVRYKSDSQRPTDIEPELWLLMGKKAREAEIAKRKQTLETPTSSAAVANITENTVDLDNW
jgi:hypothetical protein